MRRFLVCSGVHGQIECLDCLERAVAQRRPDGILFAGGVLDRARRYAPTSATEFGHTKEDVFFLTHFFSALGRLGVFCAVIPGVYDAPLERFLRIGMNAELEYPLLHLVHATLIEEKDVAVVGLGACITDYTSTDIGYYSRSLADYYFRSLWTTTKPRKVLLLPEPPQSWLGNIENRRIAGALMATYRPTLCVLGSPSHCVSAEHIAGTLVINPGHLCEGSGAWLDWELPVGEQVEFLDLRSPNSSPQTPAQKGRNGPRQRVAQAVEV
jgi:Icc-related predicted phosphoesterase